MSDFLRMWASQRTFMDLLVSKGRFPEFPVDLTTKKGQQEVVHVFQHTMDELYEAKSELRNTKRHRVTEVKGFDREHFIEELVDVQKLLLEVLDHDRRRHRGVHGRVLREVQDQRGPRKERLLMAKPDYQRIRVVLDDDKKTKYAGWTLVNDEHNMGNAMDNNSLPVEQLPATTSPIDHTSAVGEVDFRSTTNIIDYGQYDRWWERRDGIGVGTSSVLTNAFAITVPQWRTDLTCRNYAIDLPGVPLQCLKLSVEGSVMTVEYLRQDQPTIGRPMTAQVVIGNDLDVTRVTATFKLSVLSVSFEPKVPVAGEKRTIEVSGE